MTKKKKLNLGYNPYKINSTNNILHFYEITLDSKFFRKLHVLSNEIINLNNEHEGVDSISFYTYNNIKVYDINGRSLNIVFAKIDLEVDGMYISGELNNTHIFKTGWISFKY